MQRVLTTEFNLETWEKHGIAWLRSAKSKGFVGMVVDNGLPADAVGRLTELKFRVVKTERKRGGVFDYYRVVAANVGDDERCLSVPPDFDFKADLGPFFDAPGDCCTTQVDLPLANMVMPIVHLQKRAEAANLIEQKVLPLHGGLLDPKFFCSDARGWNAFVGYFDFLSESEYVEVRTVQVEKIVLNLYAAHFTGRVTVHDIHVPAR